MRNNDYEPVFQSLNSKLKENNLSLNIHAIGGFVLRYYGLKATLDIDAFYHHTDKIDKIIKDIGVKFKLGEKWLNHDVDRLMSPPENFHTDKATTIFSDTNLNVEISDLDTVILDKVEAGRYKDLEDISAILRYLNKTDITALANQLQYSETADIRILFEAYCMAFGKELFKDYVKKNPDIGRLIQ